MSAAPAPRPLSALPSPREVQAALDEPRVRRALLLTVRDRRLREAFARMREGGRSVAEAVSALRGPHRDADGQPYFLSDERVRAIVYHKS